MRQKSLIETRYFLPTEICVRRNLFSTGKQFQGSDLIGQLVCIMTGPSWADHTIRVISVSSLHTVLLFKKTLNRKEPQ